MSEFTNTVDILGDDAVCDGIINKTLSEYCDNHIISIGDYAFYNCTSLTKLDIPNVVSVGVFSFYNCSSMQTANLPLMQIVGNYAFYNGYALESVYAPIATEVGKSAFRYCNVLTSIDLPSATSIGTYAFYNCSALTAIILRSSTMCNLDSANIFNSTPIATGTGYIYVPSALVEEYMGGTNWSAYASQIRAIEDYPDITGG